MSQLVSFRLAETVDLTDSNALRMEVLCGVLTI